MIVFTELGYNETPYNETPYLSPVVLAQMGLQFSAVSVHNMGLQFRAVIYNTTMLRIMCEFPSRGTDGVGTNAWGFQKGTGLNWVASSTETGDFDISNVNTDIIEQRWQSAATVLTGIILKVDTEIDQGVFTDTLAIMGHNLTSSAVVTFEGSTSSTFGTIGISIPLQVTEDNIYWISPDLPTSGYRYWRLSISDANNPAGYVYIGTIIFGSSEIFVSGQNTDEIGFGFNDFADSEKTEGFTNQANSRAIKKALHLEFRNLDRRQNNFRILRNIITRYRTTHKCLWIPTPDKDDQRITAEFALFSKVNQLPRETHNYKGPRNQYVTMAFDLDEAS